ncbi:MAG: transcriptional regulator [Cyclobacteriaceae bacterium]|nr:transcriptional regulator [Cyclobacteriaceae bacterium]
MVSILTGDIVQSRRSKPSVWLKALKKELDKIGPSPRKWEIFRGDSFQVELAQPEEAFLTVMKIKALLKAKSIDVRIAIGIGTKEHTAASITESNGQAFVLSGEKFESLKKEKQSLAIKTPSPEFDSDMNLILKLASIAMSKWTSNSAEAIKIALEKPDLIQEDLGKKLGIKQNAVSGRLKRAYFDELTEVDALFRKKIRTLVS